MATPKEVSVWPDRRHDLLLRAGLLKGEAALGAWRTWRAEAHEPTDPQSLQILPLVYHNLRGTIPGDPDLAMLRSHYLRTWGRNQNLFRVLKRTLERLHGLGLETLVLKGAALIPLYYGDDGARSMGDFDVMVREDRIGDAVEALSEDGWTALSDLEYFDPRFIHAIAFEDRDGNGIDLHCHLVVANCEPGADDAFWSSSVTVQIQGVETRTLCTSDHLLHACVHGMKWVYGHPLRWVADAVIITQADPTGVEWDRIERLSREQGLTPHVVEPLAYLEERFGLPLPPGFVGRLRDSVQASELRSFRTHVERPSGKPLSLLRYHWSMYSRGLGKTGNAARRSMLQRYLRHWFQTDRLWMVAPRLMIKGIRLIGHRLGLYHYRAP